MCTLVHGSWPVQHSIQPNNSDCIVIGLCAWLLEVFLYLNVSFIFVHICFLYTRRANDIYLISRPISLLSIFSKLLEKVMHKRLYSYLQSNNILYHASWHPMGEKYHGLTLYDILECTFVQPTSSCAQFVMPRNRFIAHLIVSLVK